MKCRRTNVKFHQLSKHEHTRANVSRWPKARMYCVARCCATRAHPAPARVAGRAAHTHTTQTLARLGPVVRTPHHGRVEAATARARLLTMPLH